MPILNKCNAVGEPNCDKTNTVTPVFRSVCAVADSDQYSLTASRKFKILDVNCQVGIHRKLKTLIKLDVLLAMCDWTRRVGRISIYALCHRLSSPSATSHHRAAITLTRLYNTLQFFSAAKIENFSQKILTFFLFLLKT